MIVAVLPGLTPDWTDATISNNHPHITSPFFPHSLVRGFRLRSTCSTQFLAKVTLYDEHGCCWGAHPQRQFLGGTASRLADEGKGWRRFTSIKEGLDAYSRCLNLQSIVLLLFLPSITWRQMYLPHILTQWVSIPLPHHFLVSAHDVHALALC